MVIVVGLNVIAVRLRFDCGSYYCFGVGVWGWIGLVFFVLDLCCVMMLFAWVACGFWVGVCLR